MIIKKYTLEVYDPRASKEKRYMNESLYKEELLDHYRHPRNYGELPDAQIRTEVLNPSCGDEIGMQIIIEDDILQKVAFQGKGCVISQAAASLLTEQVLNKSLSFIEALTKDDMLALVGIQLGPTRLRCALLALESLHKALSLYKQR